MKIVLLGSGNVATQLAPALIAAGQTILQVYSRDVAHATALATRLNALATGNLDEIYSDADLYIISVKDDAIEEVSKALSTVSGLVIHTSGSTDIATIAAHVKRAGVLYPLQTFSKQKDVQFENIPICIEAPVPQDLDLLQQLAGKLSKQVYQLNGEKRRVLHLAAVFACNFSNHLYVLSQQLLQANDLDFNIIRPLIAETADKVMQSLPEDVQTGPAIRKDELTINKHLEMLQSMPELHRIYETLSNSIKISHK